jgi:polysaccharide biosynthesis/export protein
MSTSVGRLSAMMHVNFFRSLISKRSLALFSLTIFFATPAYSQNTSATNNAHTNPLPVEEYKVGSGDVLSVAVADAPEFGGKYLVNDKGTIEIVGLSTPVQADGLTPSDLAKAIRQALMEAKQVRDPKVKVFVEEYHGRTISVLGSVSKPAVYALQRRTTVLDALSMAGGALPNSGSTVTIVRGDASAEASGTAVGSVKLIDINRIVKGQDLSANEEVRNGDVISVSASQVVYVVGAVIKPGGFTLSNPNEGISVMQAVALAEGFKPVAATHRGLIIRQSTSDTSRMEIPVDIAQMESGKGTDVLLAPNDVLFIPESGAKKTLKVMGDIAMATVNGIAIYGIGYRIGTHP